MRLHVTLIGDANLGAVNAAVGLPLFWNLGGAREFEIEAPAGWGQRELTSYLIQRLGPTIRSISAVPQAAPLGGCNCLGRR